MAKKKSAAEKTRSSSDDSKGNARVAKIDFETALAEVERIVSQLENGELDLTKSLEQYERGIQHLKRCHSLLQQAERRVSLLSGFDADGNPVTESLVPDGGKPDEDRKRRKIRKKRTVDPSDQPSTADDSPGLF